MIRTIARNPLSIGIMLAIGAAGPLAAQESVLETIVVTSDRGENVIQDVPASIFAVDADTLEKFKHVHVGEVLNTVPGVVFNRGSGQESLIGIRSPVLTGPGSCGSFQMSQDGIPLRGAGFCNVNQLFEANSEQASAIEVVRGPGSVLFGVNALHGAINVISPSLSAEAQRTLSLDAGPHGYGRINFGYGSGGDVNRYGIHMNAASDSGYKDDSGFNQQKLNAAFSHTGDNIRITTVLDATNLNQDTSGYLSAGFEAYKVDALKKVNPNPGAFRDADSLRLHSRIEGELGRFDWMVTPYYRDTEMTFLMHFLPGTPLEENGHDSIGVQSLFAFEPSDSVGLKFGLDFEFTDGYLRQTQDGGFGAFPAGKQYDFEVGGEMLSPYIIATFQATEANQISVGVRVEDLSYDYDNLMIDGNTNENGVPCATVCRYARPADRSDSFTNSTAQVGWIHDVDSSSQLFANLAHAFRAPQATDLYRLQENQLVSDLDSEEIDSIEFGYRAGQQDVSFEVSAYYMKKKNEIFQDSSRRNVSDGRTKHRGIELNIVAALTDDVTVSAVTSFANHTYEADTERLALAGKDMDTAPKFVGNVQVDWDINDSNSLNFEWVHMGPYYEDELNEHRYAGHDLLNLRYRYDSRDDWYVAARLLNVLDTDYAERADWTTFQQDRYWVGEPASIYFTVGSSF